MVFIEYFTIDSLDFIAQGCVLNKAPYLATNLTGSQIVRERRKREKERESLPRLVYHEKAVDHHLDDLCCS